MAQHDVVLFQITAPEEETFPYRQPTQFRNLERAGHDVVANPHRLRKRYLERFQEFREGLIRQCGAAGIDLVSLTTEKPYHQVLGEFLSTRSQRKQQR